MPGSRGGFFDGVRQQQGMLQQGFGGGSVWAQYNSIGFMQAGAHMASTFGNLMGEVGFGAKADPKSSLEGVTGKQLSDITRNGRVSTMNGTDATILSDLLGKGLDPVAAPIGKNLDTPQPAASNFAAPAQRSGLLGR
jgi:hypothetical protein